LQERLLAAIALCAADEQELEALGASALVHMAAVSSTDDAAAAPESGEVAVRLRGIFVTL
jgi:hypothetical protein